jgi:PAS domain S-box-containing protein
MTLSNDLDPMTLPSGNPVCNILIVDDEPSNLLALEAILEPLGQRIVRAGSGVEALRHALRMEFCVVLLDVQMPDMDGFETAALLRRRPRTRDVPLIFLTAISKDESYVSRGYEAGAVDYLFKPYDPDALRTKVATFVELARKNALIRAEHEALRVGSQRELDAFKKWSERRYEDLADSMPQIVWTADATGQITYHNERWAEVSLAIEERSFAAIAHPDDLQSFSSGWESAVKAGREWEAEIRIGNAKGGYRFHLVRAVPRRDEQKKIIGWIGTATDIDARVRADRALRMLLDASLRLNRSLASEPAAMVAESNEDLEAVLAGALPILGDAAILDLTDGDGPGSTDAAPSGVRPTTGTRLRVAASTVEPARLDDPRFDLGPSTVGYSGRSEVFLDVEREAESTRSIRVVDGRAEPSGRGGEYLRFLRELGVSAYICVPLVSRDRTIGTLTFVKFEGGGRYESADVDLAGDLAHRIAVAIDNARLHATTERRRDELELVNRSKDVFLATLSHELRTPLNAIVGWTDMMKNGACEGDEWTRAMETIDRNAHALSGLVADLLDVSRIVTGTLKLESKLVSLASIVESAVLAARPQASAKGISLELTTEAARNVIGDPGRLRQVIGNLLSNSIKFTPEGGTVSVRVEDSGERAVVTVTDSGEGIAPEFLAHVFERFRQEETGRAKGLGLGLAIVKHLVEEHGGSVRATSEGRGKGASFTVELPVANAESAVVEDSDVAAVSPIEEPDLSGVHVLIVEDDPDGNELVCAILERYGARVTSATTAAAALDVLDEATERPQVLVSDIGLPDMDGMELIKRVRGRGDDSTIPAVALTAYASRQDATKAISAGFDAHVAKPVQPATLGSVVVRLLSRGASLADAPSRRGSSRSSSAA